MKKPVTQRLMNFRQAEKRQIPPFKYVLGIVLAIAILGYGLFEGYDLIAGPYLRIQAPSDGQTMKDPLVYVTGTTKRIAKIYINGKQIFAAEKGYFSEPLLLAYGYNIIEVKVQDQFGRQITKTLGLVLN